MNRKYFYIKKLRLSFLFSLMFISFCCSAQNFYLFAGTYTGSGSEGIYVYRFNTSTGKAAWVSNTNKDSVASPSYLTISDNGKYVYAVNETNGANPGRVSAFSFDQKNGTLHFINSQLSGGDDPCYVATTPDNKWLTVANYSGGSTSVFPLNKNGSLQPYAQLIQDSGRSIKPQQEKAHVHQTVFSPDNAYLFTPDLGLDKIMAFKFNALSKKPLTPSSPPYVEVKAGSGPRHMTFHPNKKFAYLLNEISGFVNVYKYNNGTLTELQNISAHPEDFKGDIGSAEIYVSPDGKFLYASNRGDENTITIFSVNPVSGKIKLVDYQSTIGKNPRHFIMDPTGNYLLVANQDSNNIVIFKRDKKTGLLKETGESINVPQPVCLQMVPIK